LTYSENFRPKGGMVLSAVWAPPPPVDVHKKRPKCNYNLTHRGKPRVRPLQRYQLLLAALLPHSHHRHHLLQHAHDSIMYSTHQMRSEGTYGPRTATGVSGTAPGQNPRFCCKIRLSSNVRTKYSLFPLYRSRPVAASEYGVQGETVHR